MLHDPCSNKLADPTFSSSVTANNNHSSMTENHSRTDANNTNSNNNDKLNINANANANDHNNNRETNEKKRILPETLVRIPIEGDSLPQP